MFPRTAHVPVPADLDPAALDPAIDTCAAASLHVDAVAFALAPPLPVATPYDMGALNTPLWSEEVQAALREAEGKAKALSERVSARGCAGGATGALIERGQLDDLVAAHARFADLTIVPHAVIGEERARAVNGALFLSPSPVLLMGRSSIELNRLERVLIAWDGGTEAGSAIRAALPFLTGDVASEVLLIDPVAATGAHGGEPGADLATWLSRHGVDVEVRSAPSEGRRVSEIISRRAEDMDAQLVVMGAFAHSRVRQRVFGGTTRRMIEGNDRAVLLAR